MKYLNGLKVKRLLTDIGFCHTVRYEDTIPDKVVFNVMLYETRDNYYTLKIYQNGVCVHELPSYLDMIETFRYADKVLDEIITKETT